MQCVAIIMNGDNVGNRCSKNATNENVRCKTHTNSYLKKGPTKTQKDELRAVYLHKPQAENRKRFDNREIDVQTYNRNNLTIKADYEGRYLALLDQQIEMRIRGDNDQVIQDEAARQRLEERRNERVRREQQRREHDEYALRRIEEIERMREQNRVERRRIIDEEEELHPVHGHVDPYLPQYDAIRGDNVDNVNNNIRNFAADNQNIHTRVAVKQTQNIIKKILDIPVPEEYRWNADVCSQTPAEIITACKLKQQAVLQMMMKYTSSETIYEMENGIYGKTLDAVWQFIKNSDDKECLVKILKTELEDNIGMCAQGNLTRLANVLAGYVDGIKPVESPLVILQNAMSKLMEVSDVEKRIEDAANLLRQQGIPVAEWDAWLEPLADGKEYTIEGNEVLIH